MSEQYQDLVEDTIRKTRKVEKSWCFVLLVTTASYPVLAGACTIYSQLFSDYPRRYMVHELKAILISEEQKYQSPYFEIVSLYTMYIVIFLFIGFTGTYHLDILEYLKSLCFFIDLNIIEFFRIWWHVLGMPPPRFLKIENLPGKPKKPFQWERHPKNKVQHRLICKKPLWSVEVSIQMDI